MIVNISDHILWPWGITIDIFICLGCSYRGLQQLSWCSDLDMGYTEHHVVQYWWRNTGCKKSWNIQLPVNWEKTKVCGSVGCCSVRSVRHKGLLVKCNTVLMSCKWGVRLWLRVWCCLSSLTVKVKQPTLDCLWCVGSWHHCCQKKHNSERLILWGKKKKERYHRLSSVLHNPSHVVMFCEWAGLPLTVQDDEWVGGSYHSSLIQWWLDTLNIQ